MAQIIQPVFLPKTYILATTNDNPKFKKLLYSRNYNRPGGGAGHARYARRHFTGSSADDPFFGTEETK